MTRTAYGYGLATTTLDGTVLDTWYPAPALGEPTGTGKIPAEMKTAERSDPLRGVTVRAVETRIDCDAAPSDVPDAFLRLHLLHNLQEITQ